MKMSLRKTTFMGLLIAFALISYFIESLLPPIIPAISGARLGISNIFVIYALFAFGWQAALLVAVVKSLLGPILAGFPTAMFFSVAGTALSLTSMALIKKSTSNKFSCIGISVIGSFMHNIGQMIIAIIFTSTISAALYFPVLAMISVPCGIIIGLTADRLLKVTKNISLKYNNKKRRSPL